MHFKLFTNTIIPNDDILLVYRVYFQLSNNEIVGYKSSGDFWKACCSYFKKVENIGKRKFKIGNTIIESISVFDFSSINVNKIFRLVEDKLHVFTPGYFSSICGTTGILIFLIRDCLEYCGIINDKVIYPSRLYLNCLYEQELIRVQKRRINLMLKNIYKIN
jgi:hypothetical protein